MTGVCGAAMALVLLYGIAAGADECGPPPVPRVPDICGLTLLKMGGRFDVPAGLPNACAEAVGRQRIELWRGDRRIAETTSDKDGEFVLPIVPDGEYLLRVLYTEGVGIDRLVRVGGTRINRCRRPLFLYLGPAGWPCRASLETVRPLTLAPDAVHTMSR